MMPATMLAMVVANAEPVRVAHIRGSPAACVCVCVCGGGDSRRLTYVSDSRLLQWLILLSCTADLAGAAPTLRLGT